LAAPVELLGFGPGKDFIFRGGEVLVTLKVVLVRVLLLDESAGEAGDGGVKTGVVIVGTPPSIRFPEPGSVLLSFGAGEAANEVAVDMDMETLLTASDLTGDVGFLVDDGFLVKALLSSSGS